MGARAQSGAGRASTLREELLLAVLLLAIALFHTTTIRQGNAWGDDFALYIRHAENIVCGIPYVDTGYIYNPAVPVYGPPAYPPIFPLLLAPVIRLFGLNFWAMKFEQVIFLVLALVAVYGYARRYLPSSHALSIIGLIGFNPHFWDAKDNILSDLPFLFFFWTIAWLLAKQEGRNWRWALWCGSVVYLAIATRTIGIVILAGLLIFDLIKVHRPTWFSLLTCLVCGALLVAQHFALSSSGHSGYLDLFHPTLRGVMHNSAAYARAFGAFWMGSSRGLLAMTIVLVTSALGVVGIYRRVSSGFSALDVILVCYLGAVIVWPGTPGIRLIYPLLPFYVFLIVAGLADATANIPRYSRNTSFAALVLLIASGYMQTYQQSRFRIIPETDGLASYRDLCQYIRTDTGRDAVFLCRRPRALALFTGRAAAVYQTAPDGEIWQFLQSIHGEYLSCNRKEPQDLEFLVPWIARNRNRLNLEYHNADFDLYRIRSDDMPLVKADPSPRKILAR